MIANTANPAAPNEDGSIGVTAAGAGKRDLRPWKREVSALPGSTSLTSSEQTPTDTSVGPLVTPIYDTYDWDGNENWEDDQQAVLSLLAADITDPLLTWYGATASSAIPSITAHPFPCYHADPSNNGVGVCSCTGVSETFAVMLSTGSNTGTAYQPCDYTEIPSITPAPTPAANKAKYQYTETDFDYNVIACASSTVGYAGGIPYTACVGCSNTILAAPTPVAPASDKSPPSSTKLAPKPTTSSSNTSPLLSSALNTTVQVDLNKVLVGDVSQYSLNTTLIKGMTILCGPAFADGTVCDRNFTTIPGIDYFDGDGLGTGGLTFTIQNSNYTSDNQAAAMIALVANGLQNSATGANCHLHTYSQGCHLGDSHDDPDDVC
ncbi:MAG: hypothetical protein ALECFALPRED_004483 [Alectoria fallacina]|uniref:Uncharacterized protein n=1 Tax=Alectoria fallacina TaxID=1903189 RepID=A0A8H3IJ55_9LECA|nr:MAG: hypothetical protein ALECFALPRED_004483 [Alectoria fallacina]